MAGRVVTPWRKELVEGVSDDELKAQVDHAWRGVQENQEYHARKGNLSLPYDARGKDYTSYRLLDTTEIRDAAGNLVYDLDKLNMVAIMFSFETES